MTLPEVSRLFCIPIMVLFVGCSDMPAPSAAAGQMEANAPVTEGVVEKLDPRLDDVLDEEAIMTQLADGFEWGEGPAWVPAMNKLLFSDIPRNTIYSWSEEDGLEVFLRPAGFMGANPMGKEMGTNGLLLDRNGALVMCNHGMRGVTRLNQDNFTQEYIVSHYEDKRLNSPNDAVYRSDGTLYFTDPSYGLEGVNNSPHKELDFNGVYRVTPEGELVLEATSFTNPNGIGLSPDEQTLYVAQSDMSAPIWKAFDVEEDGSLSNERLFFDASELSAAGLRGAPDGFAVAENGYIFATGPGGVLVLHPDGTHLGTIHTGQATANCAFGGDDGSTLYITADMLLLKIPTRTRGILY